MKTTLTQRTLPLDQSMWRAVAELPQGLSGTRPRRRHNTPNLDSAALTGSVRRGRIYKTPPSPPARKRSAGTAHLKTRLRHQNSLSSRYLTQDALLPWTHPHAHSYIREAPPPHLTFHHILSTTHTRQPQPSP
jgi:hypothetical protein